MKNYNKKKIVVATGGTGGHIFPASGLAEYLTQHDFYVDIVTDERGYRFLKNYENFNIKVINSATIFKKNLIKKIIAFLTIIFSTIKSLFFLIKIKPAIVFGMGGYSSFPVCVAAKILKIPFIIYENNLVLGKANKYLLPFSKKLFVAYKNLQGVNTKHNLKILKTGNIIRQKILNYKNNDYLNIEKNLSIIILGGSQAAKIFAEKLPNIFDKCKRENINLKIYQQCLESQKNTLEEKYKILKIDCEIFNFSNNLLSYLSKVDIAISRSGASMLAELLNCRIPIIAVPLPNSADNHQYENAKYFKEKGYGYLIEESEIDLKLFQLIKSIHKDKDLLSKMKLKQKNHTDAKVFEIIYNQIINITNE